MAINRLFCPVLILIFILGNLAAWFLARIAALSDREMEKPE